MFHVLLQGLEDDQRRVRCHQVVFLAEVNDPGFVLLLIHQKVVEFHLRPETPEEVANMVVYVCSPQASATTGAAPGMRQGSFLSAASIGHAL